MKSHKSKEKFFMKYAMAHKNMNPDQKGERRGDRKKCE